MPKTMNYDDTIKAAHLDDPSGLDKTGQWLAWLLVHGYEIESADALEAGATSSMVGLVVRMMQDHDWVVDKRPDHRVKDGRRWRITKYRLNVSAATAARPAIPPKLAARTAERRARVEKNLEASARARKRAAGEKVSTPVDLDAAPRPTPKLGQLLRVVMLAEHADGKNTVGLRDSSGVLWFADLTGPPETTVSDVT